MSESNTLYQTEISGALSFKKKTFTIAKDAISHGKHHFPIGQIEGVLTKIKINTVIAGRGELSREYSLEIRSKQGKSIDLMFLGTMADKAEVEQQYNEIMAALHIAYINPKVNHYIETLLRGSSFQIDDFTFSKKGMQINKKRLFRKALVFDVAWSDLTFKVDKLQFLNVGSASNSKAKSSISTDTEYKTFELMAFLNAAKQDPRLG